LQSPEEIGDDFRKKQLLSNSELAWKSATSIGRGVKDCIVQSASETTLYGSLRELNCVMSNDDFDDGLRRLLAKELTGRSSEGEELIFKLRGRY
jgi:hypothetical protein